MTIARFSVNLRLAYDRWAAKTGGTVQRLAETTGIPKRTIDTYLSKAAPVMPPANNAAKLAKFLGTTCEAIEFGDALNDVVSESQPIYSAPYQELIPILNRLSEERLNDVRRLIGEWADQVRGAAQNTIDIVADLKILPTSRLDDLKVLLPRWAEESRSSGDPTERARAVGE